MWPRMCGMSTSSPHTARRRLAPCCGVASVLAMVTTSETARSFGHWVDEESSPEPVEVWEELDGSGTALRQVRLVAGCLEASNREQAGWSLSEGPVALDPYPGTFVSADEFTTRWRAALAPHDGAWQQVTSSTPLGQHRECVIVCFYPQGAVLDTGTGFWGLADHDVMRSAVGALDLYPGTVVPCRVDGFDNDHQWFTLHPMQSAQAATSSEGAARQVDQHGEDRLDEPRL